MTRTVLLGDVISLKRGYDLPSSQRSPGNYPIVTSSGVSNFHAEMKVHGPGVVTGRYGTLGKVFYLESDFWPLNTTLYVENFKGNNPKYIAYLLSSLKLGDENIAGAVPGVNRNFLHKIKVPFLEREEQDRVVGLIDSFDKKIELNQEVNEMLEQIGQTLFRHLFIASDVREKWEKSTVGQHCEVLLGGTPDRSKLEFWEGGTIGWINSGKVNEPRIIEPSEYITKYALQKSAAKLLPAGTTVLAITGATLGQISRLENQFAANQSVIGIVGNDNITNEYVYFWITQHIEKLIGNQTGGAQQHINRNDVFNFDLLIPPKELREQFQSIIEPVMKLISNNCFEARALTALRNVLLARLIPGKMKT